MEMPLEVRWSYTGGNHCVYEVEHLFGFDVILAEMDDTHLRPVRMVSRRSALTSYERHRARQWLHAYEGVDWPRVIRCEQTLHRIG